MERKKDPGDYMIAAVDNALTLLEEFGEHAQELGTGELARRLQLSWGQTERLLVTLEERGYLERCGHSDNFRLGLKTLALGQTALCQRQLLRLSAQVLPGLARRCDETAYLAVLRQDRVVYVAVAESTRPVRVVSRLGSWKPLHCTAAGKALLAFATPEQLARLLPDEVLEDFTPRTCVSRTALLRELEMVGRRRYARDNEELETHVRCVAAPVFSHSGQPVAALSLSGPMDRFDDQRVEHELALLVQSAASELSLQLGFRPQLVPRQPLRLVLPASVPPLAAAI